jgi:DNA-binding transcriptional MerR regulator
MPYKKPEISKIYYSIGEVAEILGVNASLIRFWEKEFEVIKLRKNTKGNRVFTRADVDKLQLIYSLVKEKGYTLQGAREALKKGSDTLENKQQLLKTLTEVRELINDLLQQSRSK